MRYYIVLRSPAVDRENGVFEDKNALRIQTIDFMKSPLEFIEEEDNSVCSLVVDIEEMEKLYG